MDQLDLAIHNTAHKDESSARKLAEKMGTSYQVFINKCNYNNDTHHLTVRELKAMMLLSGDYQVLDALERDRPTSIEQMDLTSALLQIAAELGDVFKVCNKSTADNRVTPREKKEIFSEIKDVEKLLEQIKQSVNEL